MKRYEIAAQSVTPDGTYEAKLRVVVTRYDAGAVAQRKRLAVLPFRTGEGTFQRGDQPAEKSQLERQLRRALVDQLVQSRRFAVLDREFGQELQKERDTLVSPDVSPEERARLGRAFGADYVLTGSLEEFQLQVQRSAFRASGRELQRLSVVSRFSYRIIEMATGQTVVADTLKMPPSPPFPTGTQPSTEVESQIIGAMALQVGSRIVWTIYPVKIVSVPETGEVVLNQGGAALQPGNQLDAFNLGQRLIDPYTKEFIGYEEHLAATLEITRVLPKTAYARILSTSSALVVGALCRPAVAPESSVSSEADPGVSNIKSEIDTLFK